VGLWVGRARGGFCGGSGWDGWGGGGVVVVGWGVGLGGGGGWGVTPPKQNHQNFGLRVCRSNYESLNRWRHSEISFFPLGFPDSTTRNFFDSFFSRWPVAVHGYFLNRIFQIASSSRPTTLVKSFCFSLLFRPRFDVILSPHTCPNS